MNRSSSEARQAVETAGDVAQRFAGDIENAQQNRAGIERRNGPGTRLSEDEAHTPQQLAVIKEYQASTNEELENAFVEKYNNPNASFKRINISPVSERQAEDAARLLGGDYTGYTNAINSNGIQHTITRHGPKGKNDHSMSDFKDAGRIGYILDNYDNVEIALDKDGNQDFSKEFLDEKHRPAPKLKYSKRVDGTYYIIQAVPETSVKKLWVVTAYMQKAGSVTQTLDVQSPLATSETSFASSLPANNIIAGKKESVKSESKGVDWEGNREERLSFSDEDDGIDLSRYSGRDRVYMEAVKSGDTETAQRMVDEAARRAGYDMELYHGSKKGGGFTVFKDWQYFTGNKAYAECYMERDNPDSLYHVYVKSERMFDTRRAECREIFEQMRAEYGMSELQENGLPDWTDGYDISDFIEENGLDFDGVVLDEGGALTEDGPVSRGVSYIIGNSEQVKSAEPVTGDGNGKPVALSERFRTDRSEEEAWKNRDIRFSPAEEYDEIDWAGKETEEGRQIAGATVENSGRPMSAPTEERGRPMTAPTETGGEGRQIVFQSIFSLEMGFASAAIFSSVFSMCV